MPDIYGPFDGTPWSQSQWYRHAPTWTQSGVLDAPQAVYYLGHLGLTFSNLTLGVFDLSLAIGRAWVRGAGYERSSAPWDGSTSVNSTGNPRIDRIVLRRSLSAKTVVPTVIQGTPASSPSAPALTQVEDGVWDLPLYRFTVPANSGTVLSNIVDERRFLYRWPGDKPEADRGDGALAYKEYLDPNPNTLTVADTVLTVYTLPAFTVPHGRRLRLVHTVTLDSTGNTAAYVFRYRLGGTAIRQSWMSMQFAGVPDTRTFMHEIEPSQGSLEFTISGERMAGAGTPRLRCDATNGPTQFYVEDIGAV